TIIMDGQATMVLGRFRERGVLTNSAEGLFEFQGDDGLVIPSNTTDGSTFINRGTLRKASGPGTATISTPVLDSTGMLAVDAGTLRIQSPTIAQVSGNTLTAGTWQVSPA